MLGNPIDYMAYCEQGINKWIPKYDNLQHNVKERGGESLDSTVYRHENYEATKQSDRDNRLQYPQTTYVKANIQPAT